MYTLFYLKLMEEGTALDGDAGLTATLILTTASSAT